MVPSLHPQLAKIVRAVRVSNELSKVASAEAALTKVAVDAEIFGMANFSVKTASISNPVQEMANKMSELAISIYGFNKLAANEVATMNPILADAATKMATVGAIEGLLNLLPNTLSEETQKLAMEIRALNRGYGATILNDLLV
jgi:hypothetical protein